MAVGLAPRGVATRVWQWKWRVLVVSLVVGLTALALVLTANRSQAPIVKKPSDGTNTVIAQAGVVPAVEQTLGFKSVGSIKHVAVAVGATVKAGDLLASLDPEGLQLKVDEAQANLDIQKQTIIQSSEVAPADVSAAKVALASALAHQAQVEAGSAVGDLRAAEEAVAVAQAGVASAQSQVDKVGEPAAASDVSSAEATVRSAEAQLATASQKLNDARAKPLAQDVTAASLGVEQARNTLWSQQLSRDSLCGATGPNSGSCHSADATVAAAETALKTAQSNLVSAMLPANADEIAADESGVYSASAAVTSAREHLTQVKSGALAPDRTAAQAGLDQANANLRSAQAKLDQLKAGPPAADLEAARSSVEQARATLAKLTSDPTAATIELSRAKVRQAELALAEAQLALKDASLVAPFDGVVTSIALKDGDVASAGATVLTVADLSTLRLETKDLDEVSAAKVHVGQKVVVTVPALDKRSFDGTVSELAAEPTITQSGDVNYVARITLNAPPVDLRWGQTARVEFK
ncbi:MAG TPA: efflux RND transporter periplasmic adaptor subunit [Chloroflexota bacterium]|nr:efflux RND transporter periplasmic adaptor subunit [Chloroflexota bacterium]